MAPIKRLDHLHEVMLDRRYLESGSFLEMSAGAIRPLPGGTLDQSPPPGDIFSSLGDDLLGRASPPGADEQGQKSLIQAAPRPIRRYRTPAYGADAGIDRSRASGVGT